MYKLLFLFSFFIAIPTAYASDEKDVLSIVESKCKHCHGLNGEASNVLYPRLAGQNKNYIKKQLADFRTGKRKGTMNDMVVDLNDSDMAALADYFSAQPAKSHKVRNKEFAAVGWYIYHRGNDYADIPACSSCHGENAEGADALPRLAGQHKRYLADQLSEFNKRNRTNDNSIMHSVASKLTEMEIHAVALYISGLE